MLIEPVPLVQDIRPATAVHLTPTTFARDYLRRLKFSKVCVTRSSDNAHNFTVESIRLNEQVFNGDDTKGEQPCDAPTWSAMMDELVFSTWLSPSDEPLSLINLPDRLRYYVIRCPRGHSDEPWLNVQWPQG